MNPETQAPNEPTPYVVTFRTLCFMLSAFVLSWTLRVMGWHANDESFTLAAWCFGLLCVGVAVNRWRFAEVVFRPIVMPLLAAAITYYMWSAYGYGPNEPPYAPLVSAAAVLIGMGLVGDPKIERWRVPMLLAVHAWLGVWRIQTSPTPHIDVWVWHNEAIRALFAGVNPYAITMPNIYAHSHFYDPTLVVNGRVLTGYQYPPLSLLFAIPGYVLAGDYRYSQLFAMTVCGACLAFARLGTHAAAAMALWLFTPVCLFVLDQGYTEPMLAMLLALTLLCAVRWPRWFFVPLGLLFAAKQYMLLIAGPLLWLLPISPGTARARWRLLLQACAVGAVVTLPFFVVNPKAFLDSVVLLQLRQPFRTESLSLPAWWFSRYGTRLPDWLGFAALLPLSALSIWRSERSASAFSAGVAMLSFGFFALSKQAFANYYFFTLSAICGAVAYAGVAPRRVPSRTASLAAAPAQRQEQGSVGLCPSSAR